MNIQPILDYLDVVATSNCSANMLLCIKNEQGLQEYSDMVRSKRKDFESCILEWCMQHGANAALSLTIHKEKLEGYKKNYEHQKKMFISLINRMGETLEPFLTSPFLADDSPAPICIEKPNDKENKRIKNYFGFILFEVGDSIRFIDKMIDAYGKIEIPDTADKTDKKITNVYYATNHTNKKLRRVYNYLIDNGHLETDNLLSDFIYFFTGRGKKVNDCLKWKSSKVGLAYFIDAIIVKGGTKDKQFWKKAETIFRESNLANKYSQSVKNKDNSQNEKIANNIQRLLKIK